MLTYAELTTAQSDFVDRYRTVRAHSEAICQGLETEDYVVQPVADVSPPKWHLGHTTWFWETFVLIPYAPDYHIFHDDFSFVFNSYYESVGKRVLRTNRGNLSRPTVADVYRYRAHVDEQMDRLLENATLSSELQALIDLGLNHEQQHQELLVYDIKYILGHNPLFPTIQMPLTSVDPAIWPTSPVSVDEGIYKVGYQDNGWGDARFHFDNEEGVHTVYINAFSAEPTLITNGDYLEFMQAGGYRDFRHWLADGWALVNQTGAHAPLYWHLVDGEWWCYTFDGLQPIDKTEPVCHVSYYEADAFARWRGQRLLTEFEWEVASLSPRPFGWGERWEWTQSAYLPYPGFTTAEGAVGEYNGKFMSGQIVLRGASAATPAGHSRPTYRNFFQPDKQWQFSGIRLVSTHGI
ncbi:MAG: ergothioneine biosynthesis protein EgtB [Bacteroidetes bacterium]|nr:ergothioneine biosynthesis protein EgtB [Fibrella sp.]